MALTPKDTALLRDLAKKQMEYAQSPALQTLRGEWLAHNSLQGRRPMITVETRTFARDVIAPHLECEDQWARGVEGTLRAALLNHEVFGDDTVVKDHYPVRNWTWFRPFGIEIKVNRQASLGYHIAPIIEDLQQDYHKLGKSTYGGDPTGAQKACDRINEVLGDILPAKTVGGALIVCLTQNLVHLMSMENMYISMCDYPELFAEVMQRLSDDYMEYFHWLGQQGLILPTTADEEVPQGTIAFTDELPNTGSLTAADIWCYADSQESAGISADMYAELIFPYYKRITDMCGLLSYGCCEAVHPFWESCLSTLANLRKVSVSPWCEEAYMGERLAGGNVIYHRKPSPNYLGLPGTLDEDALRTHITATLQAAPGCKLEFTQRDVYTVGGDVQKVGRYVEIIRQECQKRSYP
ncbi:MAG: hypothetical protein FWD16_02670 [Clostridia bacterium]|nr:hypothetical protein [Clostridia bacterium]